MRYLKDTTINQAFSDKARVTPISNETAASKSIKPNVFYKWGVVSALTITLDTDSVTGVDEYMFEFKSGSTATTLTLPAAVLGIDTTAIEANKTYHVSIVDNIGVIYGVGEE